MVWCRMVWCQMVSSQCHDTGKSRDDLSLYVVKNKSKPKNLKKKVNFYTFLPSFLTNEKGIPTYNSKHHVKNSKVTFKM